MFRYDITFLEEKLGKFDKEYIYPRTSLIEGSLIYVEKNTKEDLSNEINQIKQDESINPTYIWGYVKKTNAIYFTRSFGENKVFIYNPELMKKTDYVKGKLIVLKNLQKDTVDNLFDQKAVFDYFYKKLWDLRLELGKEIRDKNNIPDNVALMEAQHIIDRIIFTYFICEKELISVKDYGPIKGKELFSDIIGQFSDVDSWNYLKQLFFHQFAKENAKDLDCGGEVYITTPYLNGGLFRPKKIHGISEENMEIEYNWNNVFGPLNKYSWIIGDDISDIDGDYEGNLTPEIIGHIYEKFVISIDLLNEIKLDELDISNSGELSKGNKKIGAYYTPEYITEYISRNVIKPYLYEKIGITFGISFNDFISTSNDDTLQNALKTLNEISICDPACGSGAFLIKAAEILLEYKLKILYELYHDKPGIDRYKMKKEIIIKNLYGVDIQEGAVEICKLRLWLWLMSSSIKDVEPLPNIEYNFVVGNSLVGWFDEKLDQNVLIKVDEKAIWVLDALKSGYKPQQRIIIDEAITLLNKTDVISYAKAFSILKSLYSYSFGENAEILKKTIERMRIVIYEKIDGIFYDSSINSKRVKISFDEYLNLSPLHWKVEFWDIFEKSGFDVVIGNPPYLDSEEMVKNQPKLRNLYTKTFSTAKGNWDIFCIFIEKSLILLKNDGYFGMIVPNKILSAEYAIAIRNYLQEKIIINIRDYSTIPVFEASVYPIVVLAKNNYSGDNEFYADFMEPLDSTVKVKFNNIVIQNNLKKTPQNTWSHIFEEHAGEIIEKILLKSTFLIEIAEVNGAASVSEAYDIQNLIEDSNDVTDHLKFINTGTIDRYVSLWGFTKMRYIKVLYDKPTIKRAELKKFSSKRYQESISNKIVIAGMTKKIESYYDSGEFLAGKSTTIVISDESTLKYLIGILNSPFMTFIYKTLFRSLSLKGGFMRIGPPQIKSLPIINSNPEIRLLIIENVEKLIRLNKEVMEEKLRFKNWLLTNYPMDKFSKKLENYQKLSQNLFFKELKRIKVDTSKNPEILEEEFQKSSESVNQLLENVNTIDNTIDNLVCDLYELTEAHIDIFRKSLGG